MARHSLGVVLALPEPYAGQLQSARERFGDPDSGRIPPHVTLLPPTNLPPDALPAVEEHLTQAARAAQPFGIHLRGSATFRPVSPVVFVPLVRGGDECAALERAVRSGPLTREVTFPYRPHVTVAHELDAPSLDRAYDELRSYEAEFEVASLCLFERDRSGIWQLRRELPLGAAPAQGGMSPP